ncbi:hypothetical protein [Papillibacter cinnamivorans]|uniref:Uncharacterized protein n=1 Tax=Papillibacter cinnamivorans DSM 12816 TaxID=1122930 RepID=A0A1W1Z1Q6_9FIRM|nr:hypothetical protein [Papillibacter cinnamivorans]SMC42001.1 hypothetical protein SAMN02745168_0841 [Papillibacter cinnamivorans DSM 12816]
MNKITNFKALITALILYAVFLVLVFGLYYIDKGVFVSAEFAARYAVLGAVGAVPILFRRYFFGILFFCGGLLGYVVEGFFSGLQGSFAPTAGWIANWAVIVIFALIGIAIEVTRIRRGVKKWKQEKQEKKEERERQKQQEKEEKLKAKEERERQEQEMRDKIRREEQERLAAEAAQKEKAEEPPAQPVFTGEAPEDKTDSE